MTSPSPDALREKAREVAGGWLESEDDALVLIDSIHAALLAVRNEAIAEEREACAREADEHRRLLHGQNVILDISREDAALNIIAAAIRARA